MCCHAHASLIDAICQVGRRDKEQYIIAASWRNSRHHKNSLVASASSMDRASTPYTSSTGRVVDWPKVFHKWYKYFGGVDAFNHARVGHDGKGGLEQCFRVRDEPNFPLWLGVFSFIETNTYLAVTHFFKNKPGFKNMSHDDFLIGLCDMLLNNEILIEERAAANLMRLAAPRAAGACEIVHEPNHKMRCIICSRRPPPLGPSNHYTTYQCGKCKIAICNPTHSGRTCWQEHVEAGTVPPRTKRPKLA